MKCQNCKQKIWAGIKYENKTYCTICSTELKLHRIETKLIKNKITTEIHINFKQDTKLKK